MRGDDARRLEKVRHALGVDADGSADPVRDELAPPDQPANRARAHAEERGGLLHREERWRRRGDVVEGAPFVLLMPIWRGSLRCPSPHELARCVAGCRPLARAHDNHSRAASTAMQGPPQGSRTGPGPGLPAKSEAADLS